jgi:hypothetical protein
LGSSRRLGIVVASTNQVKIRAVAGGFQEMLASSAFDVRGIQVSTPAAAQPPGDDETRRGAEARASGAQDLAPNADFWVGIEGGVADLDEEMACNRFAGTFLFPRASVLQELGRHRNAIELKELGLLKEEFGLSMAGILYRARDLGIISPAYREEQAKLFRFKGWYRKEPGSDYPTEKAHIFEQLVFHALAEEYIGESKAAELMNMPLQQFRRVRSMEGGDAAVNQ